MKITDIHNRVKQPISIEMFPPKGEMSLESAREVLTGFAPLKPDYISVTYSAGGGGNTLRTAEIAEIIKKDFGITSLSHLTCCNSRKSEIDTTVRDLRSRGIENILALRGDLSPERELSPDYTYASDLLKDLAGKGFSLGAGCYPEGHMDCETLDEDIEHLLIKQNCGADFFLSQLFFDNDKFFRFYDKATAAGISKPVTAGIMPILGKAQVSRMIFMCGVSLPADIIRLLNKYESSPDDLRKAGIEHAAIQAKAVYDSCNCGIHIYSMNHPDIAQTVMQALR